MITQSTHQPTNDERLEAWLNRTDAPDRDGTGQPSDSRGPSPWQRGAFYIREALALIGILAFLTIAIGSIYVLGQASYDEPECKSVYTRSGAMRMHCDHRDGLRPRNARSGGQRN